jgi:hypothetical protein|tara:strand:- start:2474 stop:2608 length:135 start_codon:yes stop_codon:yes gene_type:complete
MNPIGLSGFSISNDSTMKASIGALIQMRENSTNLDEELINGFRL